MLADVDLELDIGVSTGQGWADLAELRVPLLPPPADATEAAPAAGPEAARAAACHAGLTAALADGCGLPRGRFATLDAVTADIDVGAALQRRFDVAIESMEGAAAAVVAARLGVPFAQLRAVSNLVGERDRARWDLSGAVRTATDAAAAALAGLAQHPGFADLAERRRGSAGPVLVAGQAGPSEPRREPDRGQTT
jgi:futalosine hydrolase